MRVIGRGLGCVLTALAVGWCCGGMAAELKDGNALYRIDDATGRVVSVTPAGAKAAAVTGMENRYSLLAKSGDKLGLETQDQVVRKAAENGVLSYLCTNPELPNFQILKRYWLAEGGLRRELTFRDAGKEIRFVMVFTDTHFDKEFMKKSRWFGAGYLGPYLPAPQVKKPTVVNNYVQSSKGMVLCNNDVPTGSFSHYRVKINDAIVWPWFHSSINTYREKADRLYYLPDGWRMCLGTFDPQPGDKNGIRVTDQIVYFHGDVFNFFSDVWSKDSEFKAALAAIPDGPAWTRDIVLHSSFERGIERYWTKVFDEGIFWHTGAHTPIWGDYRVKEGQSFYGARGGIITVDDIRKEVKTYQDLVPGRVKFDKYHITVAASWNAPILKEHPEWFRYHDRAGNQDDLFPAQLLDFQSMMNVPECREFMATHIFDECKLFGMDAVNLDEAQQQNTINWDTMQLIRDDHVALMWKRMKEKSVETGLAISMNGSGNPFADMNAMEAVWRLRSSDWRTFCGVALGLELFTQFRMNPIYLLYWNPGCDYINRCLAMGWIPVPVWPENSSVPAIRALYECSKTVPLQATYTPDWKHSKKCEIESYSVRRPSDRTAILSFIQRHEDAATLQELNVTVELGTLGFAPEERVNVWAAPLDAYPRYALADCEIKQDFREAAWAVPGTSGARKLLYSGPAKGEFKTSFGKLPLDTMAQIVVTPAGPALYAVNDLVLNWPFAATRHVKIENGTVSGEKPVTVLLVDRELVYHHVTVDGAPAEVKPCDAGGVLGCMFSVPAGTHKIGFETAPRRDAAAGADFTAKQEGRNVVVAGGEPGAVYVIEYRGFSCKTGTSPLALPEFYPNGEYTVRRAGTDQKVTVNLQGGKTTAIRFQRDRKGPAERNDQALDLNVKGLHLTKSLTWIDGGTMGIWGRQMDLQPSEVSVDPEKLILHAGHTRKDDTMDTNEYAGFEFTGAKTLRLKFTNTYYNAQSCWAKGTHTYGDGTPKFDFVGLVVDYHTAQGYTKRVTFSTGIFDVRMGSNTAPWGKNAEADQKIDLGALIDKPETVFTLDLAAYAPAGWDGQVIFAVGSNHVLASRTQTVEILEVNPADPADLLTGTDARSATAERSMPETLGLFRIKNAPGKPADWKEGCWNNWSRIDRLQHFPKNTKPNFKQQTKGYFSYDLEHLYFAVVAAESEREKLAVDHNEPWHGDEIELHFVRPDGKLFQLCITADGKAVQAFLGGKPAEISGVEIAGRAVPMKSYTILGTIPCRYLGLDACTTGQELKMNLGRQRKTPGAECTSWGPIEGEKGFFDTDHFGKIAFGIYFPGQGRYEENFVQGE